MLIVQQQNYACQVKDKKDHPKKRAANGFAGQSESDYYLLDV
ncbi:MAG: hypothetical protein QM501_08380 [Gimesia sp.]